MAMLEKLEMQKPSSQALQDVGLYSRSPLQLPSSFPRELKLGSFHIVVV